MRTLIAAVLAAVWLSVGAAELTRETARLSLWVHGEHAHVVDKTGELRGDQLAVHCQRALLMPYEDRLRARLSEMTNVTIPDQTSYSSAHLHGFVHRHLGHETHCTGRVVPRDEQDDLEHLALRALWALRLAPGTAELDRLIAMIDHRRDMDPDILVYIASFMTVREAAKTVAHIDPESLVVTRARRIAERLQAESGRK
jgi:hypothetical protein